LNIQRPPQQITLFDLDQTLLPIDSDREWGNFLVKLGVVDRHIYESENERFYKEYVGGVLDINEFLAFALKPLAAHPMKTLLSWRSQFIKEVIQPCLRPEALDLVSMHISKGDLCCVVTATNSFVTRPIVDLFHIPHLVATEPELKEDPSGLVFTGKVKGLPNFQQGKVFNVKNWLSGLGYDLSTFSQSTFYTDSMNDLPLLEIVSNPIATNPDLRLKNLAIERSWQMINLFQ
jgi:HAD superfamily hydrolase (TIGR01490 family)